MLAPIKSRQTSPMTDLYDHLQQSRLFGCLSDVQTQTIVESGSVRRIPPRSSMVMPGEENRFAHLVLDGRAKVSYLTRDGKQPILYFVGPDELIGEQSIFSGAPGADHVETLETTHVATIPTKVLRSLVLSDPAFTTSLSELIARRRAKTESRIRHLLFLSNRDRLTHLLLDLAEQYGHVREDQIDLDIKLSHQDLANFIGSTRETVTVVLGKMQSEGLLSVRRRKVSLLNVEQLAQSVERQFATTCG